MARTRQHLVEQILGRNFIVGTVLKPYIDKASLILNRVATCASDKGEPLTSDELEMIERWLAAHYYTQMDPLYKARATLSASGTFGEQDYKKAAMESDPSGCLSTILNPEKRAGSIWLGKRPSEQIPYDQRS